MPSLTCHVPSLSLPPLPRALLPAPRPWRLASTPSVPSPSPPATRTLPTPGAVPASQLRAPPASGALPSAWPTPAHCHTSPTVSPAAAW